MGGLVLLEDFGVPVPGETILIAAAVYAGAGRLNIVVVAFVAAMVGDNVGFAIGHFGGRRFVLRWGRYVFLNPKRLDKAEGFFARHGGKVVTVARFIEGLRQANGVVAGISKMPWRRFVLFNALGAALWVGVWTTIGDTAGGHIDVLYHQFSRYEIYLAVAVVALILAYAAWKLRGRRHHRAAHAPPPDRHQEPVLLDTPSGPTPDAAIDANQQERVRGARRADRRGTAT